ncbi:MAG: hypothetical protein ACW976_04665, partial [Candidatus Ranarchaeia archaeon]
MITSRSSKFVKTACLLMIILTGSGVLLLVTPQGPLLSSPLSTHQPSTTPNLELSSEELARVNWTSNDLLSPGFETWTASNSPDDWNGQGNSFRYTWLATAPLPDGTSAGMQTRKTTSNFVESAYWLKSGIGADGRNLTLSLAWWLQENPDPDPDKNNFQVRLLFNNGISLYYFLNGSTQTSNFSSSAFFFIGGPPQTINVLSRNVTADYESVPELGSIPQSLQLSTLYFYVYSRDDTTKYTTGYVDNVELRNGTTVYIDDTTGNGDFDTTTGWARGSNYDASYVSESSDATGGFKSVNMTADSKGNGSYVQLSQGNLRRLTSQTPNTFKLNWKVAEFNAPSSTASYVAFQLRNSTGSNFWLYYILAEKAIGSWNNSTTILSIHPENYNVTGSWNLLNRNVYQDASAYFYSNELLIQEIYLGINAIPTSARMEMLFDEAYFFTPTVHDGDYEDQPAEGEQVRGWNPNWLVGYSEFTVTSTAYDGTKAGNFTLDDASRNMWQGGTNLQIDSSMELYLNLMWRLEDYTSAVDNYLYLAISFANGDTLYYYFASVSGGLPSNSSSQGVYNATNSGTTGAWYNLKRNLVTDYTTVMGAPSTYIDAIYFFGIAAGYRTEFLVDDFYIYTEGAPTIDDVTHLPTNPSPSDIVDVNASVLDSGLDTVTLHYRVNSGAWVNQSMSLLSEDNYTQSIPAQSFSSVVEYFVSANDTSGHSA